MDGENSPLDDELVVEAQAWIENNLSAQITVAELAARLRVSSRTLNRRFLAALSISPRSFWQRERVLFAKGVLENTNLTISEVAYRVGYEDASHFARLFGREMLVTPSEYRQTVRAKLFRSGSPKLPGVNKFNTTVK